MKIVDIIAIFLLLICIIVKILFERKYKVNKNVVQGKEKIVVIMAILLSIILFIIDFFISIKKYGANPLTNELLYYFIRALVISLIIWPLELGGLYKTIFKDEEKYCNIKTVVTNLYDYKIIRKFVKAHINVIVISKEKIDNKLKVIKEDKLKKEMINKTILIDSDNIKIIDKWLDKDITIYEKNSLDKLYKKIMKSRMIYDNYIKILKYIMISNIPLLLSYIFILVEGLPFTYNLLVIVLIKIFNLLLIYLVIKKLPYDKDIEVRYSKDKNMVMSRQELLFTIVHCFIITFFVTLPYIYVLAAGGAIRQAFSLYLLIYLFSMLFGVYSMINDSFIGKIFIKNIKNMRLWIYFIIIIVISMIIYIYYDVEIKNYISCMIFGFLTISLNEIIKVARWRKRKRDF